MCALPFSAINPLSPMIKLNVPFPDGAEQLSAVLQFSMINF